MTVTFHSMKDCAIKTVELSEAQVAELRTDWERLPYNNGFEDFEDFVICVCSYNC